jgi:hypothetical protein
LNILSLSIRFGFVSVGVTDVGASVASRLSSFNIGNPVERSNYFLELFVLFLIRLL